MKNSWIAGITLILAGVLILCWAVQGKANLFQLNVGEKQLLNHKTFAASGLRQLQVEASSTDVLFRTSDDGKVHVKAEGYEKQKDKYRLTTEQDDDTLIVAYEQKNHGWFNWLPIQRGHHLIIELPDQMYRAVIVTTSSGDQQWESGLQAERIKLRASSGSIELRELAAEQIEVQASSGDLTAERLSASSVSFRASSGDITLAECACDSLELQASSGDIQVDGAEGMIQGKTSSGSIEVYDWTMTDASRLRATSGDVEVDGVSFPDSLRLELRASSGDVDAAVSGLQTETNSEHRFEGSRGNGEHQLSIETTSGDIEVAE